MTTNYLREVLFRYGYPKKFEVDHETYANACQEIFNIAAQEITPIGDVINIWVGPNKGILFKNVELILTESETK